MIYFEMPIKRLVLLLFQSKNRIVTEFIHRSYGISLDTFLLTDLEEVTQFSLYKYYHGFMINWVLWHGPKEPVIFAESAKHF